MPPETRASSTAISRKFNVYLASEGPVIIDLPEA